MAIIDLVFLQNRNTYIIVWIKLFAKLLGKLMKLIKRLGELDKL